MYPNMFKLARRMFAHRETSRTMHCLAFHTNLQ